MMGKKYPSQELDRYIVRFPDGMRELIKEQAHNNNRSMNAEIISRLEASQQRQEQPTLQPVVIDKTDSKIASAAAEWCNDYYHCEDEQRTQMHQWAKEWLDAFIVSGVILPSPPNQQQENITADDLADLAKIIITSVVCMHLDPFEGFPEEIIEGYTKGIATELLYLRNIRKKGGA